MFNLDVTDVGNPMILGAVEEEMETAVQELIGFVGWHMGFQVTKEIFEDLMKERGIVYSSLPPHLKEEIDDKIWIVDEDDDELGCW